MFKQHPVKKLALAVGVALVSIPAAMAQENEGQLMEEVVATGTRLKGTASAVIQERKAQAFVADILGAEQLSRTGDSDAASALRRVTGLTLVNGKFIYVRGLGERYSSTRLNGANVPSPDLTRNVVPLDIFPAGIIESLAVQKAYSPEMPAAFGGGNIDIRTKTIPSEFVFNFKVGLGYDTSADTGFTYDRGAEGVPQELLNAIGRYQGVFAGDAQGLANIIRTDGLVTNDQATAAQQARAINKGLLKSLNRNLVLEEESLDPNYNATVEFGNSFDESLLGGTFGFLTALSYDNSWSYADEFDSVVKTSLGENCSTKLTTAEDISNSCFVTTTESQVTTQNEKFNAIFNLGYKLGNHRISMSNMYLTDSEDESEISVLQQPAFNITIPGNDAARRKVNFDYEERTLKVMQFLGQHTFPDYMNIGVDWQYTDSTAETEIPTNAEFQFFDDYDDGQYLSSRISGDQNRATYTFVKMEDEVESYGGNLSLPVSVSNFDIEFKGGVDFLKKGRNYNTSSFSIDSGGSAITVGTGEDAILGLTGYLTDEFIDQNTPISISFNEPSPPSADDYLAAQMIDAYYGSFDLLYKNQWRVSGGIRYEDFKQVTVATSSLIFDQQDINQIFDPETIQNGSILEDEIYPSLSFTYIDPSDTYQIRLGYGETVVRPDLREVVPVTYIDPLTDLKTTGRLGLQSSPIKNYDVRYEYFSADGNNYSIGAFYKDIKNPIESVFTANDEEYTVRFVNGETAEVYGIEAEWLHDLSSLLFDGLFTTGNITWSDSEVTIDPAFAGSLTNTTKRMTGHSEYVVNFQLGYDSADGNHSASLVYNVFGERILASGAEGREDAYEQPFHSLDLVYTYYPDFSKTLKFKVKNILDEDFEVEQSNVLVRSKELGVGFSVDFKWEF